MSTSKIWKLSKKEFADLFNESKSQKEILISVGLVPAGSNYETLATRIVNEIFY